MCRFRIQTLLLALLLFLLTCVPVAAAATAVDWSTPTSGNLNGVTLTMSNMSDSFIVITDLSGANYAGAPLSANTETLNYNTGSDWTATFSQPVSNLALYVLGWRGTGALVSSVTYTFNQPFTILSGFGGATGSGNTLTLPNSGFHRGILLFAGPLSSLSVATNSPSSSVQGMTFGLLPAPPVITPQVVGVLGNNGWYTSDVSVSWDVVSESAITDQSGCEPQSITSDTVGVTFTCTATSVDGSSSASITIQRDATAPTATVSGTKADGTPYTTGTWTNQNVLVHFTCSDAGSGIATCPGDQVISPDGTFTASGTATDNAGNSANASFGPIQIDKSKPVITSNRTPTTNAAGWNNSDVTVSFTCADNPGGSALAANTVAGASVSSDGANQAVTNSGVCVDNAGNAADAVTVSGINLDKTAPTISAAATTQPNGNGWYNSDVTVQFTCADNLSGVIGCPLDQVLSSEGSTVSSTTQTISDQAGNQSAASNIVTVQLDKTAPVVTVTGVGDGASYTLGSVPTAGCSTSDALSGVATQATVSVTGGNPDGTGSFTATCSGAPDNAGNSAAASSATYTVVDACTTLGLLDNFNRPNGSLGSNWAGATGQSFYQVATNRVDVQLGGPVVWKPTTYGVNQAAFVTLSTLDSFSPAQGVLLKAQTGAIPNAGAIAVVYDNLAKAVRVATLRLNTLAWTTYGNTPATFANGDQLLGCVQADGTVQVYRNNSLLTTVTLNAADQSFFNAKGGKIGLWTVAAFNLFVDDFGGGALTGVSSATLDATIVPDELADDGAEITVADNFPTDDTATAPDAGVLANRAFLPLVNR